VTHRSDAVGECENCEVTSADTVHFRYPQAILVAAIVTFFGSIPFATARWYFAPVLLVPVAVAVWAWRAGTDADRRGIVVRALLGRRRIAWSQIQELAADRRGRAMALLTDGHAIALPAVRAGDLNRLVAVSQGSARPAQ
jgi:Bacterial PH domain